ncbi:putative 2OG-Fe(II) oxygenase [Temperatibacter marinus]|uniref:2OG-Fe(II) oxygenase n=1 Tax=Temperatibacter marinus TaxID=1456591 RepID=A0AA52H970_9PROT|nr:tetratricopeptide repeat protein [Temperatibacter marinus]WND01385.1 putative 2OG-Fe(II) oxygenase [Temperatibacter marinus]
MDTIETRVQQAYQSLQAGRFSEAEQRARSALSQAPRDVNALHLCALACQATGKAQEAIDLFEQTLDVQFTQLQVVQNYLNYLMQLGLYGQIQSLMKRAVAVWSNNYQFHVYHGISLKELKRFEESVEAYDQALKIKPNDKVALHNKGVSLRLHQKPKEALACYQKIPGGDKIAELRLNRGCALMDLQDYEKAECEFDAALALNPALTDAHENLNKLYWEYEKTDKVMSTYTLGLQKADSETMRLSYISQLLNIGQDDKAEESIKKAISKFGEVPGLNHIHGRLFAKKGDHEAAVRLTEKALDQIPNVPRYRLDMASNLICLGRYEEALTHLDYAEQMTPDDQELWAYKGTCWRLLGDAKHKWLNDYDQLVRGVQLPVPEGYETLEHFMKTMSEQIKLFHETKTHPLDQSLRNGTQSSFFLLGHESKIIQDFRRSLSEAVSTYLASMPRDATHPFLRRISEATNFTFSGSWSVRLKSEGFHVNHMHPEGWLSGPSYIDVPEAIYKEDPKRAGWVKFGETGLNLDPSLEVVEKAVCPEVGLVVFFPSYIWHGTYPFESNQYRTTAPMDVMPA